jgi:hypothetical protein
VLAAELAGRMAEDEAEHARRPRSLGELSVVDVHVMLCYVMLCYVMLCYVMQCTGVVVLCGAKVLPPFTLLLSH